MDFEDAGLIVSGSLHGNVHMAVMGCCQSIASEGKNKKNVPAYVSLHISILILTGSSFGALEGNAIVIGLIHLTAIHGTKKHHAERHVADGTTDAH